MTILQVSTIKAGAQSCVSVTCTVFALQNLRNLQAPGRNHSIIYLIRKHGDVDDLNSML